MGLLCACPQSAALADIPISDCPESLGQIQKILFQRTFSTPGVENSFTIATTDPALLASWSPLLAAVDGTKVTVSPFVQNPTFEAGGAREFGGGNDTLGGIPIITGRESTSFTSNFYNVSQESIEALKLYQCENVSVFLVDEFNRIYGLADSISTPLTFKGIPVSSIFVGDKMPGGLENPDMNALNLRMAPNWSDKLYGITPTDFSPLTDLV